MHNYQSLNPQQVLEGVKKYGPAQGARKIIDWEYQHAKDAIETGVYITWWNEDKKQECSRLGQNSKCYCGHSLTSHEDKYFAKKVNTSCKQCPCKSFRNIPQRPEECGMYWLPRRKDFNVKTWRAPCKCKHTHEDHNVNYPMKCSKCSCYGFDSNFACISCDQRWEHHIVLYETEMERKQEKKAIREEFLPLSQNKEIQGLVLDKEYKMNEQYMWKKNSQQKTIGMQNNNQQQIMDGNDQVFPIQQFQNQCNIQSGNPFSSNNNNYNNNSNFPYGGGNQIQYQQYQQQQQPYQQQVKQSQQQPRFSVQSSQKPTSEKKPFLKRNTANQIKYPVLEKNKQKKDSKK